MTFMGVRPITLVLYQQNWGFRRNRMADQGFSKYEACLADLVTGAKV